MNTIESDGEKSIADELNYGEKTATRVKWEAFEFTVVGPRKVKVTNASYGYQKDDHAYTVEIERDGEQALPVRCGCKADQYSEHYDCKHKVALAEKGGSLVIDAAMAYEPEGNAATKEPRKKARADGGVPVEKDDCNCTPDTDLPCWSCYQSTDVRF